MKKFILTSIVAFLAIFSANAQMPAVGTKAIELSYKDPNGKEIALSSLKGNILITNSSSSVKKAGNITSSNKPSKTIN